MNASQSNPMWTIAGWLGIAGGGVLALMAGAFLTLVHALAAQGRPMSVQGADELPGLMPLLYSDPRILLGIFVFAGLLACSAGIGLVRRRHFGRVLTLAFGVISTLWCAFCAIHFWLHFFAPQWHSTTFLAMQLIFTIMMTLMALAYCLAVASLCRSVWRHPEAFH